jgi:hypothetical protein
MECVPSADDSARVCVPSVDGSRCLCVWVCRLCVWVTRCLCLCLCSSLPWSLSLPLCMCHVTQSMCDVKACVKPVSRDTASLFASMSLSLCSYVMFLCLTLCSYVMFLPPTLTNNARIHVCVCVCVCVCARAYTHTNNACTHAPTTHILSLSPPPIPTPPRVDQKVQVPPSERCFKML